LEVADMALAMPATRKSLATSHLMLRLRPLNRALRAAVQRQMAAAAKLARPDLSALCVTDDHVQMLLDHLDHGVRPHVPDALPTREEQFLEADLRDECRKLDCSTLPLDELVARLQLTAFEQEALLLCIAPEFDRNYERIYAFILDDLNRRFPCIELLCVLTASSTEEVVTRRHALSSHGRLRCAELLLPFGEPPNESRQELRLAEGLFEYLTGGSISFTSLDRDRAEVVPPAGAAPPPQMDAQTFERLCDALHRESSLAIGIWGPRRNGAEELVLALAGTIARPLRRLILPDMERTAEVGASLARQLKIASAYRALLWFDTDVLSDVPRERSGQLIANALANSPVPLLLTGEHPWRPLSLLRSEAYLEIDLPEPLYLNREELWANNFPELETAEIQNLAARYRLAGGDVRTVSSLVRAQARLDGDNSRAGVRDHLPAACSVVTRRSTSHFAVPIVPKRGPSDLILPDSLHRQVLEVAKFFQMQSRVDEDWGFARLAGCSGMRALFTGEPGTGKTLSAEVIAGMLGLTLYKVDLARVISKWVGETEKNLDATFREAEESHSVLFFDEAEALFGKRGEVQNGTDRYANLEVSFLLQRLEMARGLIILASNVRDQLDAAFIRRFQVVVHFSKPAEAERRRLWQLAFPPAAPLEADLDIAVLARLDMTGAAIVSAARNAALLAAGTPSQCITMSQIIHAIARQYRREARMLTPSELGPYGNLLQGLS